MKQNRLIALLLCALLVAGLFTGCGSAATSDNRDVYYGESSKGEFPAVEAGKESLTDSAGELTTGAVETNRKLIKTVNMDAETEHFDELLTALMDQIQQAGGYIEERQSDNSTYYNGRKSRYCSMVIRIPAASLDSFVAHVTEQANVTSSNETAEDITLQYVDTAARVSALETEQARLLELLAEAEDLSAILEIEKRLSEVSYMLESYASQLRTYDNLVDYATIRLSLREVTKLTPTVEPTVWQRISTGFGESLSNLWDDITDFFVWFVVNLPYLVIWAGIITVVILVVIRIRRKRRAARTPIVPPEKAE